MVWWRRILNALLGMQIVAGAAYAQQTLTLVTEDYPPFNMYGTGNETIVGISADKVKLIMARAHQPYTLQLLPWTRALSMARQDANTCVFSTTRTTEREPWFQWIGPLVTNFWTIFGRADDGRRPQVLTDLRGAVIGGYRNDAVAEYLIAHGFHTDLANYDADNPKKLLYGRFDYWATGELLGQALIRKQGLSGKIVPLFQFEKTEMYLACNRSLPQSQVDHLNQTLHEMDKDGTSATIEKAY